MIGIVAAPVSRRSCAGPAPVLFVDVPAALRRNLRCFFSGAGVENKGFLPLPIRRARAPAKKYFVFFSKPAPKNGAPELDAPVLRSVSPLLGSALRPPKNAAPLSSNPEAAR